MVTVSMHAEFIVSTPTNLEAHVDAVMAELVRLEECDPACHSAAVALNLDTREVEIEVVAEGESFEAAESLAWARIRAAIHEAGGGTRGMDSPSTFATSEKRSELIPA